MVNDVKDGIEKIKMRYTKDELALIGLGALLASGVKPNISDFESTKITTALEIDILNKEKVNDEVVTYPDIHSVGYEELKVKVGEQIRVFEILRGPYKILHGRDAYPEWKEGKIIVVRSHTESGWKSKNFFVKNNKLSVKAWGCTKEIQKRHKFSADEAKRANERIENSEIFYNEEDKCWDILIDNIETNIIKAWLILWNQV